MTTLQHEERLQKIFQNVNEWLKFAEAKNFGLLTLNAALVLGLNQIDFMDGSIIAKSAYCILMPMAGLSFIMCIIPLFPIISKIEKGSYAKGWVNAFCNWIDKEVKFENIHFYGYLKDIDESEFEAKYLNKVGLSGQFSQFEKELATQILYNSRITWLKYQFFKLGAFFFGFGVVASILALPILKLTS